MCQNSNFLALAEKKSKSILEEGVGRKKKEVMIVEFVLGKK